MEPGRRIGAGKEAEVFEYGEDVLKLYRSSAAKPAVVREAAILAFVASTGVAAPAVRSAGRVGGGARVPAWGGGGGSAGGGGLWLSRARGGAFGEAMRGERARMGEFMPAMVALHLALHHQPAVPLPLLKGRLASNIARTDLLGDRL